MSDDTPTPGTPGTPGTPLRVPPSSKLFQIYEDDLAVLEREVPNLVDLLYEHMDNQLRTRIRRLQRVITDVRWNYGPPDEVITFPADGPLPRSDPQAG